MFRRKPVVVSNGVRYINVQPVTFDKVALEKLFLLYDREFNGSYGRWDEGEYAEMGGRFFRHFKP